LSGLSCPYLAHSELYRKFNMSEKKLGYIPNYVRFIMGGSAG